MKRIYKNLFFFLFAALAILITRLFFLQIFIVEGNSMLPNLKHGSIVLVNKSLFAQHLPYREKLYIPETPPDIHRLDLVVFEGLDGRYLIKRVIGMPSDFYTFQNNQVFIDSQPVLEYFRFTGNTNLPSLENIDNTDFFPIRQEGRIPPDYYLLLGDNRENSTDSRTMGLVPEHRIRGKVLYVLKK